jgi:hypothetical protein
MRRINLLVLTFALAAGPILAANPTPRPASSTSPLYILDLAGGDRTISVEPRKGFQFQVIDKLLPEIIVYTESFTITEEEVPALTLPGAQTQTTAKALALTKSKECSDFLTNLTDSLKKSANEGPSKR